MAEPGAPIKDFIILGINPEVDPTDPQVEASLERLMNRAVMAQYQGPSKPRALVVLRAEWFFTSDPEEVAKIQPGDGCATCIAGNDQARAFLREHPERKLALCNVEYQEVW
jgi:hypothetical protein